ncbi:MAG: DUF3987 domain-containing protein [Planctomycetota bacterium]
MSITERDDGAVLLHCHAGCEKGDVVEALGLTMADLFADDPQHPVRPGRGGTKPPTRSSRPAEPKRPTPTYPTAHAAIAAVESMMGRRSMRWTYLNAASESVGVVLRFDPIVTPESEIAGKKTYRPVSLTDAGWILGGMPAPMPLYELPTLILADPGVVVHVVEGEKAADAGQRLGLVCTTSPHGANSASKADWSPLAGRGVVIYPDRNPAGEKYAAAVTAELHKLAPPAEVRIVRLADRWPDIPNGGDLADIVPTKLTDDDAATLRDNLAAVAGVEPVTSDPLPTATPPTTTPSDMPTPLRFEPFPTDALPEPAAGFIREAARAIGCDEAMLALPMLAMLAGCIGLSRVVRVRRSWLQACTTWTAIIAESGGHKSPALSAVMATVERVQARYLRDHEAAMQQHAVREAEHAKLAEDFKRGKASAGTEPPLPPEPPTPRRVLVRDATVESLAPILRENPRGLLQPLDELAGWFGSFDAYKGGKGADVTHWLSMHDGKPLIVDRKGKGTMPIHVPAAAVSITGGIQPGVFERSIGEHHRENGLLGRLLMARPPRQPKRWTEDDVSQATEDALGELVGHLLALEQDIDDDGQPRPRVLPMTNEAREVWRRWYDILGAEQADLTGDLAAAWSKLESYALRLSLVVLLAANPTAAELDAPAMRAGIRMVEWFKHETRRVYAAMNESNADRDTRELVELVERKGGDISGRELVHASRKIATVGQAEATLQTLADAGLGHWVQPPQKGRGRPPARRLTLTNPNNPSVNVNGNPTRDTNSGIYVDVDSVDARQPDAGG